MATVTAAALAVTDGLCFIYSHPQIKTYFNNKKQTMKKSLRNFFIYTIHFAIGASFPPRTFER